MRLTLFVCQFHRVWKDQPDLFISWKNLSYTARIPLKDTSVPNLVSSVAHGLAGLVRRPLRALTGAKDHTTQELRALQPCAGVIRPATMTLVLAPPGHGKTTLLKVSEDQSNSSSSAAVTCTFACIRLHTLDSLSLAVCVSAFL